MFLPTRLPPRKHAPRITIAILLSIAGYALHCGHRDPAGRAMEEVAMDVTERPTFVVAALLNPN